MTAFEREVIDRLARIEEQNITQFHRLEKLEKTVNGNGVAGLSARGEKLETEKSHSGKVISLAALVLSLLANLWQAFKQN
ncbi:MAG: hypothetical protein PHI35_06330 [Victivallaceae bacterium]|nr:hypothetical protein [Victivallaceae bacterium]